MRNIVHIRKLSGVCHADPPRCLRLCDRRWEMRTLQIKLGGRYVTVVSFVDVEDSLRLVLDRIGKERC